VGGVPMKRLGSGGGASRAPSSLSIRSRDSPVPRGEFAAPGTPSIRPVELSRTPSTATVTQSRPFLPPSSPRQPVQRSLRGTATAASRRAEAASQIPAADDPAPSPPASPSTTSSDSDSDSDSNNDPPIRQSQLFRRPPPFQRQKKTPLSNVDDAGEDDSGDDSPTFLPFATSAKTGQREDPSATLRENASATNRAVTSTPPRTRAHPSTLASAAAASTPRTSNKGKAPALLESSASSNSSAAPPSSASGATPAERETAAAYRQRLNALSPRHRAELARLSPRGSRAKGDGSDGTPSMGSSFSDLDGQSFLPKLIWLPCRSRGSFDILCDGMGKCDEAGANTYIHQTRV
jgi:hypothetical protein